MTFLCLTGIVTLAVALQLTPGKFVFMRYTSIQLHSGCFICCLPPPTKDLLATGQPQCTIGTSCLSPNENRECRQTSKKSSPLRSSLKLYRQICYHWKMTNDIVHHSILSLKSKKDHSKNCRCRHTAIKVLFLFILGMIQEVWSLMFLLLFSWLYNTE